MKNYDQIMERIQAIAKTKTQSELACLLDIKQARISDSKKRQAIPSDWYIKLFEKLGVNPDWLKKGVGPIYLRTEAGYGPSNGEGEIINPVFFVDPMAHAEIVIVYSMHGDYTDKSFSLNILNPIGKLAIPKLYAGNGIVVLKVDNEAAVPTVRRGAYVGIDTISTYPASGEIFAVYIPYEGIVLRKLFLKQDEKCFILKPENKYIPESYISVEQKSLILGRLCWVIQNL